LPADPQEPSRETINDLPDCSPDDLFANVRCWRQQSSLYAAAEGTFIAPTIASAKAFALPRAHGPRNEGDGLKGFSGRAQYKGAEEIDSVLTSCVGRFESSSREHD